MIINKNSKHSEIWSKGEVVRGHQPVGNAFEVFQQFLVIDHLIHWPRLDALVMEDEVSVAAQVSRDVGVGLLSSALKAEFPFLFFIITEVIPVELLSQLLIPPFLQEQFQKFRVGALERERIPAQLSLTGNKELRRKHR